jgi:hypothetical protein
MKEEMEVIHLWPGASWHEDGYIVGNRKGLETLRDSINAALLNSQCDRSEDIREVTVCDGEGYGLHVIATEHTDYLAVPYTWEPAVEHRENAVYPWDMMVKEDE